MKIFAANINDETDYIKISEKIRERFPERVVAANSLTESNRNLSLTATALIAKYFPKITQSDIFYNKDGKPYIKNESFFNISHTKDAVFFVKAENEVGIDAEKIIAKTIKLSNSFFTNEEIDFIGGDLLNYYKIWTLKESFYKNLGVGLKFDGSFNSVKALKDGIINYCGQEYYFNTLLYKDYVICICLKGKKIEKVEVTIENFIGQNLL